MVFHEKLPAFRFWLEAITFQVWPATGLDSNNTTARTSYFHPESLFHARFTNKFAWKCTTVGTPCIHTPWKIQNWVPRARGKTGISWRRWGKGVRRKYFLRATLFFFFCNTAPTSSETRPRPSVCPSASAYNRKVILIFRHLPQPSPAPGPQPPSRLCDARENQSKQTQF